MNPFVPKHVQTGSGSTLLLAHCGRLCRASPEGLATAQPPKRTVYSGCDTRFPEPLGSGPPSDGARRFALPGAVEDIEADYYGVGADQMRAWMRDNEIKPT